MRIKQKKAIAEYWAKYYIGKKTRRCVLCHNSGLIEAKDAGESDGLTYCFCPNGHALRAAEYNEA